MLVGGGVVVVVVTTGAVGVVGATLTAVVGISVVVATPAATPSVAPAENTPAVVANTPTTPTASEQTPVAEVEEFTDSFDREAVMKFINDYGLLTYDVRSVRISNYLASLYKMARLLTQTELCKTASKEVVYE